MNYASILELASNFKKTAQGEPCFFVDMDETLLFAFEVGPERAKTLETSSHIKIVEWGAGKIHGCIKRPYADEFLTELNRMGRVTLATASPPSYAHAILEAEDLKRYFDKIYTGADLTGVSRENCPQFFLIDNADMSSEVIGSKMQMLGVETQLPEDAHVYDWSEEEKQAFYDEAEKQSAEHFISAPEFNGNLNDTGLITIMNQIKQRLSSFS